MSNILNKIAKSSAEKVYKIFGNSSGGMLLITSVLGLTFSAVAQIMGICFNKKYTTSQKAFMIPQEIGELIVSAMAIFIITKPSQKLASKLVKTGKILPKELVEYMKMNKLSEMRGKTDFNFGEEVNKIISQIKKSNNYIKTNAAEKEAMLKVHNDALDSYNITADAVSAIATTAASALTVGCVAPILRNRFASYYRHRNMDILNYYNRNISGNHSKI